MKLRRANVVARLDARYGGQRTGTMILLQDLLTEPGLEWMTAAGLFMSLRVRPKVERRSVGEIRSALRIMYRKRWVVRKQRRPHEAIVWRWAS
jgi:hypothetical protein